MSQVASWGAYLMKRKILAMSFAPRDNHEAQVQFALERGVPAVIGVLGSIKLPYPARSFDMAQCSRCLIPWSANSKLLELPRSQLVKQFILLCFFFFLRWDILDGSGPGSKTGRILDLVWASNKLENVLQNVEEDKGGRSG